MYWFQPESVCDNFANGQSCTFSTANSDLPSGYRPLSSVMPWPLGFIWPYARYNTDVGLYYRIGSFYLFEYYKNYFPVNVLVNISISTCYVFVENVYDHN